MADSKNVLKRPIGPLPTWAWVAIVGGVVVGWAWWSSRKNAGSGSSANASQVPQFVNQTYTNVGPPDDDDMFRHGPIPAHHKGRRPHHRDEDARQDRRQEARQDRRQEARQDRREHHHRRHRG